MAPRRLDGTDRDAWVNLQIRNDTVAFYGYDLATPNLVSKLRATFYTLFKSDRQRRNAGTAAKAQNSTETEFPDGRVIGGGPWALEGGNVGLVIGPLPALAPGPVPAAAAPVSPIPDDQRHMYVFRPRIPSDDNVRYIKAHNIPLRDMGVGWETQGGDRLGAGGFGVVRLFRRLDDDGNVIDRVAVKDNVYMQPENMFNYTRWHGDVSNPMERKHMEIFTMEQIRDRPGSDKCVRLREGDAFLPQTDPVNHPMWYRIYMEFCEHGPLDALIQSDGLYNVDNGQRIPEPALWSIFEDLVETLLLLRYGGVRENEAIPQWEPLVHRDLKPDNILIAAVHRTRSDFPRYPIFKLGDFGLCVTTTDDHLDNPLALTDFGTTCWRAPEQNSYFHQETYALLPGGKLGEWTNIWQVGMVMIALMNQDPNGFEDAAHNDKFQDAVKESPQVHGGEDGPRNFYSEELVGLVERCVMYDSVDRPELRLLRRLIRRFTRGGLDDDDDGDGDDGVPGDQIDLAEGMRKEKGKTKFELRLNAVNERYKLHTAASLGGQP